MKRNSRRLSASTACPTEEGEQQTGPSLVLQLSAGCNLFQLAETCEDLRIYGVVSQGYREWTTSISQTGDWPEVFELNLDFAQPFEVNLYDEDEYGTDTFLAGFVIPPNFLHFSRQSSQRFRVKLVPDQRITVTPSKLCRGYYTGPSVEVKFQYFADVYEHRVVIHRHMHVAEGKDCYTLYEALVQRNDGKSWAKGIRYSQVVQTRKELIRVIPGARKLPFPSKTYFGWLWKRCSRFDEERVRTRKYYIEMFLNTVLSQYHEFKCKALDLLLDLA